VHNKLSAPAPATALYYNMWTTL